MGGFKRLCMGIFSLAGLFALAALVLTWYGPWTDVATALLAIEPYAIAVLVCVAILAIWLLVMFLRAIFSRKPKVVEVTTVGADTITVTLAAIGSQASHIVEADGTFKAKHVYVEAKRRGKVRVRIKVLPYETVDVVARGTELHDELVVGLQALCGDKLTEVSLQFLEPQTLTDAMTDEAIEDELATSAYETAYAPAEETTYIPAESTKALEQEADEPEESSSEITVPMGGSHDVDHTTSDEEA